jgi:hypothetical protein
VTTTQVSADDPALDGPGDPLRCIQLLQNKATVRYSRRPRALGRGGGNARPGRPKQWHPRPCRPTPVAELPAAVGEWVASLPLTVHFISPVLVVADKGQPRVCATSAPQGKVKTGQPRSPGVRLKGLLGCSAGSLGLTGDQVSDITGPEGPSARQASEDMIAGTDARRQRPGNMVPVPKVASRHRAQWARAGGGPPNICAAPTTGPTLSGRT